MAKLYFGSAIPPKYSPDTNGAYFRKRELGIIDVMYQAQAGDFITHVYYQRGAATGAGVDLKLQIYEASVNDKAQATLFAERLWGLGAGTAFEQYAEVAIEHIPLVPGNWYLVGFRGLPGSYTARAQTMLRSYRKVDLVTDTADSPLSLSGVTWGTASSSGAILGVMIANQYAKSVVTLGEPAAAPTHIARDVPTYRASGVQCRLNDFTNTGGEVLLRPDGTFKLSDKGTQTFEVEFSLDGVDWSSPMLFTVKDRTDIPTRFLGALAPKAYWRVGGTTDLGWRTKAYIVAAGTPVTLMCNGSTVQFGATQGRVVRANAPTPAQSTQNVDLTITSWTNTLVQATMVGDESVLPVVYWHVFDAADQFIGAAHVKGVFV